MKLREIRERAAAANRERWKSKVSKEEVAEFGAQSLDEALAMARFYVNDGVTHVVATPHCHRYIHLLRTDILPAVDQLNDEFTRQGVPLIRDQKMTPILAHPERFSYLTAEPELLKPMMDAGAWIQITVDSLLGNHGPAPQVAGEVMLRMYPDAVLASDAHNTARCSGMSAGYAWVREHFGNERAEELLARGEQVRQALLERASR